MQERAETTRRSLLQAAAHLFDERGYAGTSISDISSLSGHTSGAIYFHYGNKERIALAIVEAHLSTWPRLLEHSTKQNAPPLERLVNLSFTVARTFRDDVVIRAGARLWAERKAIKATLPTPFVGWIDMVATLLEQARSCGDLAPRLDPAPTARTLVAAFFGLHTVSESLDGRRDIEAHLHDFWNLLLASLQADPDPSLLERVRSFQTAGEDHLPQCAQS